ncbi:MAG: PAS domain S-box protein [Deltaproteobacteria bacterium]|nr:PAS domain S-box protein [Deltaproteobacteria bacterium]
MTDRSHSPTPPGITLNLRDEDRDPPVVIRRGKQAKTLLRAAIVGGGRACCNLLQLLDEERLSRLGMRILGVFDVNPDAPGLRLAQSKGLFTSTDLSNLAGIEGLNLIIELTGSGDVLNRLYEIKPPEVSLIDHRAARLIWDLIQTEMDNTRLEKERQRYQEEVRKQTQEIMDSLPYRIMVVRMDMLIETVNRTFLQELGMDHEEVIGRPCYEVRHRLGKPCKEVHKECFLLDRLEEMKEKGFISTYQEYLNEEGETRFDVITVAPFYDEKGEIVRIVEASRDVTERMKLEREVQKSNTFFEKVIQSTVDGIVVVDMTGKVLIFNQGMEALTGYSAEEIIDRGHLSSFYNIETAKENMKKMRSDQFGPPGKLNPTSMTITSKEGEEIPVTLSASMITINGREIGSVGVFTDMRQVLKMRKDLEEANLQLVQSQKIASVGRMAAGVAHEINNPLSAILIYAELLKEALPADTGSQRDLQEIIDQTMRCKRIVSDLLEFSRKSAGKTGAFQIEEAVGKCLNLLTSKANFQDIRVTTNIAPGMPDVTGDIAQIQQVFTNLLINAADAMEGKGAIHLEAAFDPARSRFVIQIADTGPGIPKTDRDKVFDIFFTSKPVGKGTGLGLSISQNIVKLHSGEITFHCPPEGGTVFVIELPLEYTGMPSEEESVFIGLDES